MIRNLKFFLLIFILISVGAESEKESQVITMHSYNFEELLKENRCIVVLFRKEKASIIQ